MKNMTKEQEIEEDFKKLLNQQSSENSDQHGDTRANSKNTTPDDLEMEFDDSQSRDKPKI
jgi:hypothetical protein